MTVQEMIDRLKEEDPNKELVITSSNFEQSNATIRVSDIYPITGKFVNKNFRDAFDGDSYSKEVFSFSGDTQVLKIS